MNSFDIALYRTDVCMLWIGGTIRGLFESQRLKRKFEIKISYRLFLFKTDVNPLFRISIIQSSERKMLTK